MLLLLMDDMLVTRQHHLVLFSNTANFYFNNITHVVMCNTGISHVVLVTPVLVM